MGKFKPTQDNIIGRHARKAAQIIEERGWVQGMEKNAAGQVCLVGAFQCAISPIPAMQQGALRSAFSTRFGRWMQEHCPDVKPAWLHDLYSAPAWNDRIFQSKEDALAWLNKFADDLDPQR